MERVYTLPFGVQPIAPKDSIGFFEMADPDPDGLVRSVRVERDRFYIVRVTKEFTEHGTVVFVDLSSRDGLHVSAGWDANTGLPID